MWVDGSVYKRAYVFCTSMKSWLCECAGHDVFWFVEHTALKAQPYLENHRQRTHCCDHILKANIANSVKDYTEYEFVLNKTEHTVTESKSIINPSRY